MIGILGPFVRMNMMCEVNSLKNMRGMNEERPGAEKNEVIEKH